MSARFKGNLINNFLNRESHPYMRTSEPHMLTKSGRWLLNAPNTPDPKM